jgi:CO/xanthine dehydrogenase FAD-binding subunit
VAGLQDMMKDSATGPSQCVDVTTNDDAMSERSTLCMTGSCLTHSDLLASNALLFDIFMFTTNPEL